MQLFCNNVRLDLYEDADIQLKKTNPAYAFGDLSSERSTQFKLPATPTNDRVLALARIPAYTGNAMRVKLPARLVCGLVVREGFLYISEYTGKDYSAILVSGLAYDVKTFDKFNELIISDGFTQTVYDADNAAAPIVSLVKYRSNLTGQYAPSIDLGALFEALNAQGLFKISGTTGERLRLIRSQQTELRDVVEILENLDPTPEDLGLSTYNNTITVNRTAGYYGLTNCFRADGIQTITFPENTPQNLCLAYLAYNQTLQGDSIEFFGSRRFDEQGYYGEPLAGQTVTLDYSLNPTGNFWLIDMNGADFITGIPVLAGGSGGHMDLVEEYRLRVHVSGQMNYDANAMLNDLVLGDLLKLYASCTGKLINIKADGSVEFVTNITPAYTEPLLIEQNNVARTFSNYAQANTIKFEDTDSVLDAERLTLVYDVPNVNISETKDLMTLKATEGGIYEGTTDTLYLRDVTAGLFPELEIDAIGLAGNEEYMQRVELKRNALLTTLCAQSTQVKVSLRISFYDFDKIDSSASFLVNGTRYTWTEATWQKETAKITLQKIA